MIQHDPRPWRRYVALGDSFTEGMTDVVRENGRHVGWADLLAGELAARALADGDDGIDYANLAIRGRLTSQVVAEQLVPAIELRPDLASLAVGVNDTLRRRFDLHATATELENGVRALRATGADVLVFAFGDPGRRSRVMGTIRTRIAAYNSAVEAIADRYDCYRVSFWDVAAMDDDRFWDEDRLHLSPIGHIRAAQCAMEALGIGDSSWRTPPAPLPRPNAIRRAASDAQWVRGHFAPWVGRRIRGISSGDGITPKHPEWVRVTAPDPRMPRDSD